MKRHAQRCEWGSFAPAAMMIGRKGRPGGQTLGDSQVLSRQKVRSLRQRIY